MHYLTALLAAAGADVTATCSCFFAPLLPISGKCDAERIAVYPDIEPGNPLGAARIVRYMLYFASAYHAGQGGKRIPKQEKVFIYHGDFLKDVAGSYDGTLEPEDVFELPNIEHNWCFPETKTIENVLYVGKGNCPSRPSFPCESISPADAFPNHWAARQATMQTFRRAKNVYTADHYTVVEQEAMLCGCNVFRVVGPDKFEPPPWTMEQAIGRVMVPARDVAMAERFSLRVKEFFAK